MQLKAISEANDVNVPRQPNPEVRVQRSLSGGQGVNSEAVACVWGFRDVDEP